MISFGKYGDPEERAGDQCCIQDWRPLGNLGELACMYTSLRVEFVVSSFPCFESFFSGYSGFIVSSKTNMFKFQFNQE